MALNFLFDDDAPYNVNPLDAYGRFRAHDDDDDEEEQQREQQPPPEEKERNLGLDKDHFFCDHCGSTECYQDDTDGAIVCSECFTQSQQLTQSQNQVLDYDEIQAMAARGGSGNLLGVRSHTRGHDRKGGLGKRPLPSFDTSQPLPSLELCLQGYQAVLQGSLAAVSKMLRYNEEEHEAFLDAVGHVWFQYLEAWKDGADKYGTLYPDIRFSMRDAFLASCQRGFIQAVVSEKVTDTVKNELDQQDAAQNLMLGQQDADSSSDNDNSNNTPSRYRNDPSPAPAVSQRNTTLTIPTVALKQHRRYKTVADLTRQLRNKGREEAAIYLKPSMELVPAILWLVLAQQGITPGHLVEWVANGSLPLLHAFDHLLEDNQNLRDKLRPISHFFQMAAPPQASHIERYAAHLAIASGMQSTRGMPQDSSSSDEEDEDDHASRATKPILVRRLRLVPLDAVPIMIAQLVVDLVLGQRVVDISLSLIGHPPPSHHRDQPDNKDPNTWLPPPLQRAHPKYIRFTEQALGVIVVACKMCPGWETWQYVQPPYDREHNGEEAPTVVASREDDKQEDMAAAKAIQRRVQRFIPWNDDQFRLLKNEHVSDYLDFLEENVLDQQRDEEGTAFPAFTALLDKAIDKKPETTQGGKAKNDNANKDRGQKPKSSNKSIHDGEVLLPGRTAMEQRILFQCSDAGFTPYISYPDKKYHTHVPLRMPWNAQLTAAPFHQCYVRLVEYIAYKSHVDPCRIHAFVADLDEEVVTRCQKRKFRDHDQEAMRRKRKRKRWVRTREATTKRRRKRGASTGSDAQPDSMLSQTTFTDSQVTTSQFPESRSPDAQDPNYYDGYDDTQFAVL